MVDKEELQKIKDIIESWDCSILPKEYGPYTASLLDEEFPNGMVLFRDRDGVVRMAMPREVYDAIVESKGNYDQRNN